MKLQEVVNSMPCCQKVKIVFPFFNNCHVKEIVFRGSVDIFVRTSDDAGSMEDVEVEQIKCSHKNIISIRCMPCDFSMFVGDRIFADKEEEENE